MISSALQIFWTQTRSDKIRDLIRIQTVWYSDRIPEKLFENVISWKNMQTIKTSKIILYLQRGLFNVIIFIIPIIISINLSKFLKIQTNKMACKPNRRRSACALVHAEQRLWPNNVNIQADRSLGCLFMHQSSKLGYLPTHYVTLLFCEHTDQTIIKCRCDVDAHTI